MPEDLKTGQITASFKELVYSNMLMVEAVVELLMQKNVITRDEVLETVKKLKEQTRVNFGRLQ